MTKTLLEILEWVRIEEALTNLDGYTPSYNVSPTQSLPIIHQESSLVLDMMSWGIPSAAASNKPTQKLFNARLETLRQKRSFAPLTTNHRCVVLCDGYFEWKNIGGSRIPHLVQSPTRAILPLAGLWTDSTAGRSFTIITRPPREDLASLHDRMPYILPGGQIAWWLQSLRFPEAPNEHPSFDEPLEIYPVTSKVNSPTFDTPLCIERQPVSFTPDLFEN